MWSYLYSCCIIYIIIDCSFADPDSNHGVPNSIEESNDIFANLLFPVENLPDGPVRGQGRTAEWYKQFKVRIIFFGKFVCCSKIC